MAGTDSAPRGLWPRGGSAHPGDSTPPGLISIALARWHPPPDSTLHDCPSPVQCPGTDNLLEVNSSVVPGGYSLLVTRAQHHLDPRALLPGGQRPPRVLPSRTVKLM